MQAAGDFIAIIVKFSARVQHCHNNFGSRNTLIMHFSRNPPTVIEY